MSSFAHPASDFLFDLPEELLALVVEFAAHSVREYSAHRIAHKHETPLLDTRCIKALCLTCRTLRRLAQPWLYH